MKRIAFTHQKGGVGKTTLSAAVASELNRRNYRVALIDLDPQGTLRRFPPEGLNVYSPEDDVPEGFDFEVCDTPPFLLDELSDLAQAADLIVIPAQPSPYDVDAAARTLELIRRSRSRAAVRFVLNQCGNDNLTAETREALAAYGIPICQTEIWKRTSYRRGALEGGIHRTGDRKAQNEIETLTTELLNACLP